MYVSFTSTCTVCECVYMSVSLLHVQCVCMYDSFTSTCSVGGGGGGAHVCQFHFYMYNV